MLFLKRKKKKENDNESEALQEKTFKKKPKSKDFKDLNPKNSKKRKEPKKPWGRKERYFVLFILLFTAGTSAFLALSSRSWKLPGFPRFKLPHVSLPVLSEETFIIEGGREDKIVSERVITEFNSLTQSLSGVYGFYVIDLTSGFSYGVNEREVFVPASLNKLPVMLALYMEADAGKISLDTKYALKNTDKLQGSGSLYSKPAGMLLTYRDLVRYMAKESDNTAYNIARRIVGQEKIEAVVHSVGMENTIVLGNSQKTTPYDIGLFFQRVYQNELAKKDSVSELLTFLTDTVYEDWLAAGVPENIRVAHKFGRELHVVNDAGIVFLETQSDEDSNSAKRKVQKAYVVVIMSKGIVENEANLVFPQASELIYNAFFEAN